MILLLHSIYAGSIPAVVICDNRLTGKPWHFQCYFACSIHACHILNIAIHGWMCWLQISLVGFNSLNVLSDLELLLLSWIHSIWILILIFSLSRFSTDCCVIGNVSTLGVGLWGFKSLQSDWLFISFIILYCIILSFILFS